MGKHNDIDLSRWKDYEDITTDSLWLIDKRDNTGVHTGKYHKSGCAFGISLYEPVLRERLYIESNHM